MSGRSTASRSDSMKAPLLGRGARLSGGSNKVRYTILHVCADGVKVGYTCSLRSPGVRAKRTSARSRRLSTCRERYIRITWRARFFPHAPLRGLLQHPHHKVTVLMLSGGANTAARNLLQRRITAIVPHYSNIKQSVHVGKPNHAATKTTYHSRTNRRFARHAR